MTKNRMFITKTIIKLRFVRHCTSRVQDMSRIALKNRKKNNTLSKKKKTHFIVPLNYTFFGGTTSKQRQMYVYHVLKYDKIVGINCDRRPFFFCRTLHRWDDDVTSQCNIDRFGFQKNHYLSHYDNIIMRWLVSRRSSVDRIVRW